MIVGTTEEEKRFIEKATNTDNQSVCPCTKIRLISSCLLNEVKKIRIEKFDLSYAQGSVSFLKIMHKIEKRHSLQAMPFLKNISHTSLMSTVLKRPSFHFTRILYFDNTK